MWLAADCPFFLFFKAVLATQLPSIVRQLAHSALIYGFAATFFPFDGVRTSHHRHSRILFLTGLLHGAWLWRKSAFLLFLLLNGGRQAKQKNPLGSLKSNKLQWQHWVKEEGHREQRGNRCSFQAPFRLSSFFLSSFHITHSHPQIVDILTSWLVAQILSVQIMVKGIFFQLFLSCWISNYKISSEKSMEFEGKLAH